ncbi:type IVB pilus formation outer membrane protein, R64 PilN family [Roseateles sp. YR242]|uniref:PilN family type IVB pilus formation outer membrane protein n=1 Tax=Roseateles sp. YR242 TaxID=1855305 RepID=UPI0008CAE40B|nr:PilN family type IVB pilus formation outer membrane protein [Roseateles sp. YR242]SEK64609.1 type IVB pilus formation outer membrane protein, R64 PilN family [Roseateles sp. YR242]
MSAAYLARWVRSASATAWVLLAGCTGLTQRLDQESREADRRASVQSRQVGQVVDDRRGDGVQINEGIWIGKSSVRLQEASSLPPVFSEPVTFNRRVRSLAEFAERITAMSGVPTRVTADATDMAANGRPAMRGNAPLANASGQLTVPPPNGLQQPLPAGMSGPTVGWEPGGLSLVYRAGDLKGLLDLGVTRFGVSWKYTQGAIEFLHVDTRSFQINAVPGDSALSANVGSRAGSDSGVAGGPLGGSTGMTSAVGGEVASGNGQATAVRSQLSVFASLEKSVQAMLSPSGTVVSSTATGTLTVTDTPAILDRVERFIERENRTLSKQIMINVTVLAVSVADEDSYGLRWDLVYKDLFRQYGVSSTFGAGQGSTSFSASILDTANSKFAGSSVMISALSTQGKVRKETSASVATLNHQPVPVQVARQTAYLKSSQTTISANVGSSTSLTPGVVTSGFTMTVLPNLLDNGTVILQFSTDISTLRRIQTVSSTGATTGSQIQTPEIDTRNFLQRVAMKSGQTLVVSGFEQLENNVDRQGTGHPSNFLLGGGVGARSNKEVIVILITPITMPGA